MNDNGFRKWGVLFAMTVALGLPFAQRAGAATVITFSDQQPGEGPPNPNPYTSAQGLPTGVTATLTGFERSDQLTRDHTPTSDNRQVYGLDNNPATITFNTPIEVPSFWIATGDFGISGPAGTVDTISGSLLGQTQFTATNQGNGSGFIEVTGGAGKSIDRLTFSNYQDSQLDDITVAPSAGTTPEPSNALTVITVLIAGGLLKRTRSCRRTLGAPRGVHL